MPDISSSTLPPSAIPSAVAATHGPAFDTPVPPGGYLWWYLDGLSDDRRCAITVIAFVGSVFSPYYAWAGRRDPLDHCAVNVAVYGDFGARWAMTERGRNAVARTALTFRVGPSMLRWDGAALVITLDERGAPLPHRIRGEIRVTPEILPRTAFALDAAGRHRWQPIAPRSRISVALSHPACRWDGDAYLDSNLGTEPLEDGFSAWSWSRAHLRDDAVVLYDARHRDGGSQTLALRFRQDGTTVPIDAPPVTALPLSGWRVPRETRSDAGQGAIVARTLVDAPFYARSVLATHLCGEAVDAIHETLLLDRFRMPLVRALLPFRMPRRARWSGMPDQGA
jgi:carotenoid 1,2-hydratase